MEKTKFLKILVISLILCVLAAAMNLRVLAITEEDAKGTITISNVEAGVNADIYKLITINYDYIEDKLIDLQYTWVEEVKNWLESTAGTEHDYSKYLDFETLKSAIDLTDFYSAIVTEIKKDTGALSGLPKATTLEIESDEPATTDELEVGAYLVLIEEGLKIYKPSVVNIVPEIENGEWTVKSQTIVAKASDPNIVKTINEDVNDGHDKNVSDNVSITDTIFFDLRADIPQYPAYTVAKNYYISDILKNGLLLDDNGISVFGVDENGVETELVNEEHYTTLEIPARPNTGEKTTFTLSFDYDKIKEYEKIHISYGAKLNADETTILSGEGNENIAYLDYNNNPYDTEVWNSKTDSVKVYTYNITIRKVSKEDTDVLLSGAEFELTDENGLKITFRESEEGKYYKTEKGITTLKVGSEDSENKGFLQLKGLDAGTYYLTETKAPTGYNKLTTAKEITISEENVAFIVQNSKGIQLPVTGQVGNVILTASGILLIGLCVIYKKHNKNS